MKVICTGSAGFIGSHLCDYLIEKGHEVIGIDNFSTGDMKNVSSKVKQYTENVVNLHRIRELIESEKPDWVFHNAANARTQLSVQEPLFDMENNIRGTLNMLIASRDNGVKRFIYASSCIINAPNTPYYVSKLAGEEYTKVFNKIYGLSTISLRYSNVYGSLRQSEKGSHINALASLHKTKRETGHIFITGDGTQTRQWTHYKDICRANLLAAESNETGMFDICTGVNTSMNEVAKYFDCPIKYIPLPPGDAKDLSVNQDPKPAKEKLGYEYEIPFGYESLKPYL